MPRVARRSVLFPLAAFLASLGLASCRPSRSNQPAPAPAKTFIHVTNGDYLDAVVYVVDRGQSVRLGIASSNRTTTFELPPHIVFAPRPLSFVMHPIGASARPSTGDVVIEPGDDIELRLNGGRVALTKRPP